MKSTLYEKFYKQKEEQLKSLVVFAFSLIFILLSGLYFQLEQNQLASERANSSEDVLGATTLNSEINQPEVQITVNDTEEGLSLLTLKSQDITEPVYADIYVEISEEFEFFDAICLVDGCDYYFNNSDLVIRLNGVVIDASETPILSLYYDPELSGAIRIDNRAVNESYLIQQGSDVNLLSGKYFYFEF